MATSLFGSSKNNRTTTSLFGGSSGSSAPTTTATNGPDLETLAGLQAYAAKKGFEVEVKEKKLSFLQRLGRGLSALEPVNAFYQSQYEGKNFATEYLKDIFAEAGSAITGREMNDAPKKTFKDVLLRNGMKDREGKIDLVDVLGLAGDIATDPGTYFGGSLVKGAGKVLGVGGRAVKGIAKVVAPEKVAAAEVAYGAAKDALGRAFIPAYGTSKYARNAELQVIDDIGQGLEKFKNTDEINPLISEAEKYKNVEDFIRKYKVEESLDLNPGITRIADTSETGLYHGAGLTNLKSILSDGKLKTSVSKLDNVGEKVISASGNRSVANSYGVVFELDDDIPKRVAPKEAIKGDVYDAFEYRIDNDVPLNKVKNITIPLNKAEGLDTKIIWNYTGKNPEYISARELANKFEEKGIKVIFNNGSNLTESELTNIWNKSKKGMSSSNINSNNISASLLPFVEEAVRVGDPGAFAKTVTKEMLQGEDPVSFFNRVTKPKELGTEMAEYKNIIAGSAERIGREQVALFEGLSNQAKDDLVDGLFTARRNFGASREELIQKGLSYEEATKTALSKFDTMLPEQMFKEPETIRFFTKSLLPELEKSKAKFAAATDMQEDLLMSHFFPAIKKSNLQEFNKSLRIGSEGYLKRYKGILSKEDIITDPVEAYARRAFELEKNGITRDTLKQWVEDFGLPVGSFKNADEAFAQGYRPLKEKGMFGKEVGWVKENDYRFLKDTFDPSFKAVEDLAKSLGFDAVTSLFKKSVTGLFAPFHIRNYMSGVIQNYQALGPRALNPTTIAKGNALAMDILKEGDEAADALIKIGGKSFNKKEIVDAYRKRFGISSQYISDFGLETQEQLTKKESKLNPFYYARRVGNFVETQQKATAIVAAIQKGYDLPQALKMAEKAGFDYSKMTAFEKNILRRIVPFYSFSRKNLELQLRTLASNPERLATLTKAGRALGTPQSIQQEEETLLPEWMRNRIVANFGESEYGLPQVLAGFGLPLEETADLANDGLLGILSRVNPLFKVPLERATGKDFFRDQDIKDVYSADEYAEAPDIVKNFLKIQEVKKPVIKDGKTTGEERTVYRADPERLHIMRNLFTSRGVSYLHTLFGDSELSDQARVIKSLTGMRPYEVDENAVKFFEDRDNYRDFIDVMAQLNLVKTFERAYIPKTEEEKRIEEAKKKASKKKGESLFE